MTSPGMAALPFCGNCAAAVGAETGECAIGGATLAKGSDLFCINCGNRIDQILRVENV